MMFSKSEVFTSLFVVILTLSGVSLGQRNDARRRSPIQSIPVGADVKRDTEFNCPEEFGYYPHPTDCTQYYVCVFGGALLESCTGGLMYSHELQTCDWPRNVGCSSGEAVEVSRVSRPQQQQQQQASPRVQTAAPQRVRVQVQQQQSQPPPPPPPRPSPNPVVTSRGQPTHLNHQEIVKQQLYAEVDEQLPPAEELENDRQQRVLRGQPSSIGQVQKDRDGQGRLLQATPNAIPSGKVGAFSFGTQIDQEQIIQNYRVEPVVSSSPSYTQQTRQQNQQQASSGSRALYNGSLQYDPQQFDPYYNLYDEDQELYKDADYGQQYNSAAQRPSLQQTYRGTSPTHSPTPTSPTPQYTVSQSNVYSSQPSAEDYDDALINSQIDDQNQYQQPVRSSTTSALDLINELGFGLSTLGVLRTSPAPSRITIKSTTSTTPPTSPPTVVTRAPPQRTNTRGRGSAHYSTASGGEQTVNTNRGTPPSRVRPTLKPSTSIVSKAQEFVDIYRFPPRRPDTVYPTPQVDKTAAKCRKDVCLLPDCWCGGKDIPGNLPVEEVPQIVLLTFDDAVNDLNKATYSEIFEQGRKNPNGCPISATFYVSHEWTDYSQVQNLYADGHEMASHTVSHSFGEQFTQKKWNREVGGQREILSAYGGVKLEDVRGMRAPFLSVGGNKMFKMLYDSNFTYDSSMPVYENRPPSWPYTLDYKLFHDCMIPPCPTRSYPGVWEVPMVMWQDLNGGRCSMGDACSNPPTSDGVFKMLLKNFDRHYTTNRAPFGLFYHAAWFTQPHHKEGFIMFLDTINAMKDVFLVTNWQALQWVRDPTPLSRMNSFQPFHCNYQDRPKRCNNPKVCNLWHKSGVRYMRTCQPCPDIYPWTGKTGIRSSRIDNEIEE